MISRSARRCLATAAQSDSKSFSKTLLLPKTPFPLWTDPQKSEVPFRLKTSERLYNWQYQNAKGHIFVLQDGPPYANGNLHMGHALNKILKDIINRYYVLQGRKVHYVPGWDCHGLPIENKALQDLGVIHQDLQPNYIREAAKSVAENEMEKQRQEFQELGIMANWERSGTYRTLDHEYEIRQLRVFQEMVDKGLIYRHYRPVHYSPSSRSALAEAELTHRDHNSNAVYVLFRLTVDSVPDILRRTIGDRNADVMVWTTTPWTLTANMGIAVHPDLEYSILQRTNGDGMVIVCQDRKDALHDILGETEELCTIQGSHLLGAEYHSLFLTSSRHKIIPSDHVTPTSGTGLVHCAPAHGAEDYLAFRTLGLLDSADSIICHVDRDGAYSEKIVNTVGAELGRELVGLDVLEEGSKSVVRYLQKTGTLAKQEKFQHQYPYDWKTGKPVIVTATSQWFANLDKIKDDALSALQNVAFFPPVSRTRLESFVRSRSEWCISRQRVWGVPIPWLHHLPSDRAFLDTRTLEHILPILEKKGVAYWWDGPVDEFVPDHLRREVASESSGSRNSTEAEAGRDVAEEWRKGTDTMDVWFDSGTAWTLLRDAGVRSASGAFADVCLEGSDQHRGWFQSLLLTATAASGDGLQQSAPGQESAARPYATLITHGMVLDEDGRKMSKSEGNVISPMVIVKGGQNKDKEPAYGADVLRFWVASCDYWRDMSLGPTVLAQAAEAVRKLRNSARFILGNIGDVDARTDFRRVEDLSEMSIADRYVMHELYELESTATVAYANYEFPRVVTALTKFANITLSSFYFDITKDTLYADSINSPQRRAVVTVLEQVLKTMTPVMAPITPHLAEEIAYTLQGSVGEKGEGLSYFTNPWHPLDLKWRNEDVKKEMDALLVVRNGVLGLLENARRDKNLRNSLEADIEIHLPPSGHTTHDLLVKNAEFLKTLFIVSNVKLVTENSVEPTKVIWLYEGSVGQDLRCVVKPASLGKCPRCWTFSRRPEDRLCPRCDAVIQVISKSNSS
ncbi:isoleucyl-tRNA synthetase [Rickenella mellea]|uniref:isoleucine--tRNA ligase n=1 Tax=Rickenella mellea TaxID=50990 RepID=A0A4Y7QBI4_9AGAM|nr:isoleucyl-tRNA synthetase [Rickenella mellea]